MLSMITSQAISISSVLGSMSRSLQLLNILSIVPRFIPFIYSNFYVADVCMTVPSGKLICPPTGFVILHFEVQWVYTVYRSLSRIMFPVPTIACSGSIHRFHRYSCYIWYSSYGRCSSKIISSTMFFFLHLPPPPPPPHTHTHTHTHTQH